MTIVAGVDFGTLNVRMTLADSEKDPIGTASASYTLHRREVGFLFQLSVSVSCLTVAVVASAANR
jgi:ribulose kinase